MRSLRVVALLAAVTRALAAQQDTTELERLKQQIEAITQEIEALRLGSDVAPVADSSVLGFGPAASGVYRVNQGVSIGGYGEVVYENFAREREDGAAAGRTDQIGALRAIVYIGYKFSDRLLFNSEIELEHATEAFLEFGYIEYRVSKQFGFRGGLLLLPMGYLNELHEPSVVLTAKRPETESALIPSTWRENGLGLFGHVGFLSFRAYVVNGLNAAGFAAEGFRGGRQKGSEALAEHMAVVGRVDAALPVGLTAGASAYLGGSGQDLKSPSGPHITARTFIWEAHAQYRARGLHVRALFAQGDLDEAARLNQALGLTGSASVGSRLVGWYAEAAYDILRATRSTHQLLPYVRYEALNTQQDVPTGFTASPANDRQVITVGVGWKPIASVALKTEYELHSNDADTGVNQVNVQLGYLF